jgi:hypothetical protein
MCHEVEHGLILWENLAPSCEIVGNNGLRVMVFMATPSCQGAFPLEPFCPL